MWRQVQVLVRKVRNKAAGTIGAIIIRELSYKLEWPGLADMLFCRGVYTGVPQSDRPL